MTRRGRGETAALVLPGAAVNSQRDGRCMVIVPLPANHRRAFCFSDKEDRMKVTWEKDINYGDSSLKGGKTGYARTPDGGSIFVGAESDGDEKKDNWGGCLAIVGGICLVIAALVLMGGPP